jgi:hypothetical protein
LRIYWLNLFEGEIMKQMYRSVSAFALPALLAGLCFAQTTQNKKSYTFHGKIEAVDANDQSLKVKWRGSQGLDGRHDHGLQSRRSVGPQQREAR